MCDGIGGTLKKQLDEAIAFNSRLVIQRPEDIVAVIEKNDSSIRLSVHLILI